MAAVRACPEEALLMFTGLIEGVGRLDARDARGGDARLRIAAGTLPFDGVALGESIAVNGVCLTVVAFDGHGFEADASNETLALTTLGALPVGHPLNLERAMRPDDRLGGHLVSGHVDGVGRVLAVEPDARAQRWRFAAPAALLRYVAQKGSICVDGVSLTVNAVDAAGFEVALIPHTVAHTAFAATAAGDPVNLEVDVVAPYVERLLSAGTPAAGTPSTGTPTP
jgi:riboflavin synthase